MELNFKVNKKDDNVMKILNYLIMDEDYKPVVVHGVEHEIWLENLNKDYKIVRLNMNHLHNVEQYNRDLFKANVIMKKLKKKTYSFKMNMLNILFDVSDDVLISQNKNLYTLKVSKISDFKKNEEINRIFKKMDIIQDKKSNPYEFLNLSESMNLKTYNEERNMTRMLLRNSPMATYTLMAINIIVFIVSLVLLYLSNGSIDLIYMGANNVGLLRQGEIYRLFTSVFLHANIFHLGFNMYALFLIGPEIESVYGRKKFLIIYFISAILGGLLSAAISNSYSVGASGAIFGLFGSLLYFGYNYRNVLDGYIRGQIIPVIVINLLLGFLASNVDVAAHIGGLIGGTLASGIVELEGKKNKTVKTNAIIIFSILTLFLIYMIFIIK